METQFKAGDRIASKGSGYRGQVLATKIWKNGTPRVCVLMDGEEKPRWYGEKFWIKVTDMNTSPEAKLGDFARRIHLQDEDVDYLLELLQEARGLGSLAGAAAEREACARIAANYVKEHGVYIGPGGDCGQGCQGIAEEIATAIRQRG